MAAWKVLLTDGLEENGQAILRESAELSNRSGISADELLQVIGEYDALIVRGRTKVTPAVMEAAKNLKVVGRAGVGVDNIDLAAAKERGITVVNSPIATTLAVAELTLGLMLAVVREVSTLLPAVSTTVAMPLALVVTLLAERVPPAFAKETATPTTGLLEASWTSAVIVAWLLPSAGSDDVGEDRVSLATLEGVAVMVSDFVPDFALAAVAVMTFDPVVTPAV